MKEDVMCKNRDDTFLSGWWTFLPTQTVLEEA
jgi:hypothetical protein